MTDIRQVASSSQTECHILSTQTKSNYYSGIQQFLISEDNLKLPGYTTIPGISSFSLLESSPLSLLLYCTLLFPASLSLTIQEKSHEGGSHRKFSQMLAKVGEGRLCRALALTFCQTPLSPPGPLLPPSLAPPSSSVYHFSQPLSSSLRLAANNAGVVRYHRLLQGVEAAERLSSKTKHLYSVIHLIVIPHSSIPLPSASLSIIHLTLIYSACLSVRGHLPAFQQPGETCVCCVTLLLQHICVSVCGLFDGVNR